MKEDTDPYLQPGQFALVIWDDAVHSTEDGVNTSQLGMSVECRTVGHVIEHTHEGIQLGMDEHEGSWRFVIGIPTAYQRRVARLKEVS